MDENIIKASILYSDALKENHAELLLPLEDFKIVYVPNMPHSHRTVWIEENLLLLYVTEGVDDFAGDFLQASSTIQGIRRGVYCTAIENDDIDYHITNMASNNLQQSFSRSLRPQYFEISPEVLLKVPKLLVFT